MAKGNGYLFLLMCLSLPVLLISAVFSQSVAAISVVEGQENIVLTIERGSTYDDFQLFVQNINEGTTITSTGDITDFIRFGNDDEEEFLVQASSIFMNIPLTITIPENTGLGEYEGDILADGIVLSDIRLKVTLELSDVKAYDDLSDIDEEVGFLRDKVETLTTSLNNIRSQMSSLEDEVTTKMEEIYKYQKDLTSLETEKNRLASENTVLKGDLQSLQEKSSTLEESNRELNAVTGAIIGTQVPGMFLGGLILGILVMVTVIKRELVKKKLKDKMKRSSGQPKSDEQGQFRYNFGRR